MAFYAAWMESRTPAEIRTALGADRADSLMARVRSFKLTGAQAPSSTDVAPAAGEPEAQMRVWSSENDWIAATGERELRAIATDLGWPDQFDEDWADDGWNACDPNEHMTVRINDCETAAEVFSALKQMRVDPSHLEDGNTVTLTMQQWADCHLGTEADGNRMIASLDY